MHRSNNYRLVANFLKEKSEQILNLQNCKVPFVLESQYRDVEHNNIFDIPCVLT